VCIVLKKFWRGIIPLLLLQNALRRLWLN